MLIKLFTNCYKNISENKDLLNELDQKIGDGDHGTNMLRGFTAILEKKESFTDKALSQILNETAMVLITQVAGSSGPLFGTALMKAGASLKGNNNPSLADFTLAFRAGVEGVQMRGKSTIGEKTMLDVLIPTLELLEEKIKLNQDLPSILTQMNQLAQERVDYTATIVATKGRAAYLGERSIGHIDPGAYSAMLLIRSLQETLEEV